jgi:phosphoribosylformimino-5-aminoimidazole carboxamide ribotide isomerase
MLFLPVLDIQNGIVVRAVAGRRSEYRPLVSRLTNSTDPLTVAEAIRSSFGWWEVYVADLDSIAAFGLATNLAHYGQLHAAGFRLWLDAGVRTANDADRLAEVGVERLVVGLETIRGPAEWRTIVERIGGGRAVFSLDLHSGEPITPDDSWRTRDALAIADRVVAEGGRQMIVLDLARVGTGGGPATGALCAKLVRRYPDLAVYTGGGIRDWDDVRRLETAGVAGVLLASALHDGTMSPISGG